jgi:hypothetical protein
MHTFKNILASALLSIVTCAVALAQDATAVYNKVIGSTVTIMTDKAQGSGFVFFENNLVVTNWHVLAGATKAEVIPNGSTTAYKIMGIVAADIDADIAIVRVQAFWKTPLRSNTNTNIGQVVYAIGSPKGVRATISNGILSGETAAHLQTTAATSPGSSGGPLVDSYGYVVGVNVAKVRDAENLNLAIPIAKVLALQTEIRTLPIALADFNEQVGTEEQDEDIATQEDDDQKAATESCYELNWKYGGTDYEAILVLNDDVNTDDKVIVRFYSSQNRAYSHVIQQLTRDKIGTNTVLLGNSPVDLITQKRVNYTPDNFYLKQTNSGFNIYIYDGTKDRRGEMVVEPVTYQKLDDYDLKRLMEKWSKNH